MASAAHEPRAGVFGEFRLTRRIAIGGMAEIFEARRADADPSDSNIVLKILLPQYAEDPDFVRMLRDEAAVCQLLSHPNLVQLHEFGRVGRRPFIVMELVDGIALSDLIKCHGAQHRRLPIGVALYVMGELLEALAYVHEACDADGKALRIVHRDVTPHNILLSRAGDVRLGDFGIARSNLRDARTRTGVIKGKLRYLAPEQVTGSSVDARTDLYAAGVLLFLMLTGTEYLVGENEIDVLRVAENPVFRRPSELAEVDGRADDVVRRALQRFPEERYQDAGAFLRSVRQLQAQLGAAGGAKQLAVLVEQALRNKAVDEDDSLQQPDVAEEETSGDRHVRLSRPTRNISPRQGRTDVMDRPLPALEQAGVSAHEVAGARQRPTGFRTAASVAGLLIVIGAAGWMLRARSAPGERVDAPGPSQAPPEATASATPTAISSFEPEPSGAMPGASASESPRPTSIPMSAVPALAVASALVSSNPASSASPVSDSASSSGPQASERELSRKLDALRSSISTRGILIDDLPAPQLGELRAAEQDLSAHRVAEAESKIAELERDLGGLRVDAPLVQRKMARVNGALQAASRSGLDVSSLHPLSAQALQTFMEGKVTETNATLNELLRRLAVLRTKQSK